MSRPLYSVLICGHTVADELNRIEDWLSSGIKVIWFGERKGLSQLSSRFPEFVKFRLLQLYEYAGKTNLMVVDGDYQKDESLFLKIVSSVNSFNLEQYRIEHCNSHGLIITASAGTGKTHVMIDRILYLIHVKGADPSSITMITFTNDATNQMRTRLQEAVINRYELTHLIKYLEMLENICQIQISTIDSFSHRVLNLMGTSRGYGDKVNISSESTLINDSIEKALDSLYIEGKSVKNCLGTQYYDAVKMIKQFHKKLATRGYSGIDCYGLDWGSADSKDAIRFQKVLKETLKTVENDLADRRLKQNSVSLTDLQHELAKSLQSYVGNASEFNLQYLFVDEFQDTSDDQIRLLSSICALKNPELFVVGDPKQSIYRFRGADDSAFDTLMEYLPDHVKNELIKGHLVRNYRSYEKILNDMNVFFRNWVSSKLLSDYNELIPCCGESGGDLCLKKVSSKDLEGHLVQDISSALNDPGRTGHSSDKVVVLVRSNYQLTEIDQICKKHKIPMIARRDKLLFQSDAARDLYALLNSYLYPGDPISLFNYFLTPYCRQDIELDGEALSECNGLRAEVMDYLEGYLSKTNWGDYRNLFKVKPALAVIKDIIRNVPIVRNYLTILERKGVVSRSVKEYESKQYLANLDKILSILQKKFVVDGLDLPHICQYLKISIATNREELEEDLGFDSSDCAYAMTTHKAKGLEFDTVIIPYNKSISEVMQNEIILSGDKKRIGWKCSSKDAGDNMDELYNSNHEEIHKEEYERSCLEETRILYVAMTRAIRKLTIYVRTPPKTASYSWSRLLGGTQ